MKLLVCESPGKIKTLKQILGPGWRVEATLGHIRSLANTGPDKLGFTITKKRVACQYEIRDSQHQRIVEQISIAIAECDEVYLGTDADREGEAIAWHVVDVFKHQLKGKRVWRVSFREITQAAVLEAIRSRDQIDMALAEAARCRDCLDKLVGYSWSPFAWAMGGKSAGRVQTAALRLVCIREESIASFFPQSYWSVYVNYGDFRAYYLGPQNVGGIEDSEAGMELSRVPSQAEANRLIALAERANHRVISLFNSNIRRHPPPPFRTSTLQKLAGEKLGFSPIETMRCAQKLYEMGYITYVRSDSSELSQEGIRKGRAWLSANDLINLPAEMPRKHVPKGNAQEGHEAIRPTDFNRTSLEIRTKTTDREFAIYQLIWMRTIAYLAAPAELSKLLVVTDSQGVRWQAKGQVVTTKGYTKYWNDLPADVRLPKLNKGQFLACQVATAEAGTTQPPVRYREYQLIEEMERSGIGRPATFCPTTATLISRKYVQVRQGRILPTELGLSIDRCFSLAFPEMIKPEFTAAMEVALDRIANGEIYWEEYLFKWYSRSFIPLLTEACQLILGSATNASPGNRRERVRVRRR